MSYKVIVWGTGFVGKMVIRELVSHPQFELAGVIVNAPEKDGVRSLARLGGTEIHEDGGPLLHLQLAAAVPDDRVGLAHDSPPTGDRTPGRRSPGV